MNQELIKYTKTNNIINDTKMIIEQAFNKAYKTVNIILVQRNYLIGKRIVEEILSETRNDNYGKDIINKLSIELTKQYGKGFNKANLYLYAQFYKIYRNIFDTVCQKSFLSWSHYRILLKIDDREEREWYEKEAIDGSWSARTLQRNLNSDYYHRILISQQKDLVKNEMIEITKPLQDEKLEFIKNPFILEFLGIPENNSFKESDLEKAIINHLQKFIMELGKGYSFVGRQVRIQTEKKDYYIDLVFFNYILNCFVLINLKTEKIEHQDVGQMDMYVRMYDELIKEPTHNPTLGIILCQETDYDIARYSVMHDNEQLFATKYKLYLPTEEELKREIEQQKFLYYLQKADKK